MSDCINVKNCPCTYPCARHGRCCECISYHRQFEEFPGCLFTQKGEKTYDRSLEMLLQDRAKK